MAVVPQSLWLQINSGAIDTIFVGNSSCGLFAVVVVVAVVVLALYHTPIMAAEPGGMYPHKVSTSDLTVVDA